MPIFIDECGTSKDTATSARQMARPVPLNIRGASSVATLSAVVVLLAIVAAAVWWFMVRPGQDATTLPGSPATATAPAAAPAPDAVVPTQELSIDQLYKEARTAMGENRMVSPAGNNALEFYLAILSRQPDDSGAADALRELFPFATGSAEEQINSGQFDEANRIMSLLAQADPSNYTLTILRSKLEAKRKLSERELALKAQEAATAASALAASRTQGSTSVPATAATDASGSTTTAPVPGASAGTTAATAAPTSVATATPPPAAPAPVPEPVGETRDALVVTPPRPSYPPAAVRARQNGWVEVEFTVAADGAVQNVKVIESNPSRVFDREAVRAVQQAKFEPRLDRGDAVASTLRRRIEFKLGN